MQGDNGQQPGSNGSFYQPDDGGFDTQQPVRQSDESIDWQASEYIHHDKGALWLVGLVVIALIIIGVAVWFGQWIFAALAGLMAVTFGVYAFRKPHDVRYHLSDDGLQINDKTFKLDEFRSFGVIPDGAFYSIQLIPTKRFLPAITIYFADPDGEQIVDILGAHLPMLEAHVDPVDTFMRKLRF